MLRSLLKKVLVLFCISSLLQVQYLPGAQAKSVYPTFKGKTFQGSGDDIVDFEVDKPAIVKFSCPSCSGNTVLETDGRDSLIVNEIGAYTGEHLINMNENALTTSFEITADSDWTLAISDANSAKRVAGKSISGKGTTVLYVPNSYSKVSVRNVGSSNFVVYVWPRSPGLFYFPLLINEIGSYKGTKRLKTPGLIYIRSLGEWNLTFSK